MTFKLLAVSGDAKTIKGEKIGILTGVMYFAPVDLSGYQVCAKATVACSAACLFTAGRGVYQNVRNGRMRKTKLFFENRELFMSTLYEDVRKLVVRAKNKKMRAVVRPNGTSDIPWEKIAFTHKGNYYRNIMEAFPEVTFYDYTKIINRKAALVVPNYHLTFSLADGNDKDALKALAMGLNVAAVIRCKRKDIKPATFSGFPTVDGDKDDARFLDNKGSIVLLRAKGKAQYDASGFVKPLDYQIKGI
jgi:hypothetical protein